MTKNPGWHVWFWPPVLVLVLALMVRADLSHRAWVTGLSAQGSPPPAREQDSPTGYALGQRQFLGTHERGETYRWIAETQQLIAAGPLVSPTYLGDSAPDGRPRLLPKLYALWLTAVSWGAHVVTGEPIAPSVEQAAFTEPVVLHVLAFLAVVAFMWSRFGVAAAGLAGLFFALFPPISGQFLPGVLSTRTGALLLAAYSLALNLPPGGGKRGCPALGARSALAAGLALWLDPAIGFSAVLVSAVAGAAVISTQKGRIPCLSWSLIGSAVTLAAWLIDQNPWNPSAGELRYVHPLYAWAWFGIGLGLDGWQNLRTGNRRGKWPLVEIAAALPLASALVVTQLKDGYQAWLYPSAGMGRLTSLDETKVFRTAIAWLANASGAEVLFIGALPLAAVVALVVAALRSRRGRSAPPPPPWVATAVFAGVLVLAFFRIRWIVVALLVALPLLGALAPAAVAWRRALAGAAAVFLLGLFVWGTRLPVSLARPAGGDEPSPAEIDALIDRHFSHWIASHNPGERVCALAPPDLSDSLVFHGGCQVLMSTAWESYPGQVAASRILSAPEASEAEAVLQSARITHVVLPSWDQVLPLLVRAPREQDRTTLYARLQRWVFPPYLRPIPYHLPAVPGYLGQKLVVFKVVPAQDEALSLSRLAEYFAEMDRAEPATLASRVLAQSFPDDPNAAIARATVAAYAKETADFDRELARLAADAAAGRSPFSWDRRVQRAIVLALGHQPDLARAEVAACAAGASREDLFDLTPLQAYRLRTLATHFGIAFPDPALARLLESLGAEFSPAPAGAGAGNEVR